MATQPDFDDLGAELRHLEHRRKDLLRLHDRLSQQLMAFPNEFRKARVEKVTEEFTEISDRIARIEALLLADR